MKSILEQGFIRLDDALNKRWEVLKDLKHQRVIKELIFTKEKIRTLIESVVSKNSETEIWINVLTELQNSDLYNEIKKILSYPVVKEEMKREITSFDGDNNELTDFILSKLVSLHSYSINSDKCYNARGTINNHSNSKYFYLGTFHFRRIIRKR